VNEADIKEKLEAPGGPTLLKIIGHVYKVRLFSSSLPPHPSPFSHHPFPPPSFALSYDIIGERKAEHVAVLGYRGFHLEHH